FFALNTYFDRVYSTDWNMPLRVAVFPINGDGSAAAATYVDRLDADAFLALESFFERQAQTYGLHMERPVRFGLAPRPRDLPPMLAPDAGRLGSMLWSLRARYWAWRQSAGSGPPPDIKLFVLHHAPS